MYVQHFRVIVIYLLGRLEVLAMRGNEAGGDALIARGSR